MATVLGSRPAPLEPPQRYGTGLWAWLLQRLTGLLLFVSVAVHFTSKTVMPVPPWLAVANDSLLIVLVVYHAMNGLRVVLLDLSPGLRARRTIFWGCLVGGVAAGLTMLAAYLGTRV